MIVALASGSLCSPSTARIVAAFTRCSGSPAAMYLGIHLPGFLRNCIIANCCRLRRVPLSTSTVVRPVAAAVAVRSSTLLTVRERIPSNSENASSASSITRSCPSLVFGSRTWYSRFSANSTFGLMRFGSPRFLSAVHSNPSWSAKPFWSHTGT